MAENCFIILLRGINVSGKNIVKMAELRASLSESESLSKVQTYIQSGNIVLSTTVKKQAQLEQLINKVISENFGIDVPVFARNRVYFIDALKKNPFHKELDEDQKKVYFTFLSDKPAAEKGKELESLNFPDEHIRVVDDVVYFYSPNPVGNAKFNNNLVEKKLGVRATTRNHRTLLKLLDMVVEC